MGQSVLRIFPGLRRHDSAAPEHRCGPLTLSEVRTEKDFDLLEQSWDQLVARLEYPSPFQGWEWNRLWWKHFGHRKRLRILQFRETGQLLGIAQFSERRYGVGLAHLSSLVPIGWHDGEHQQLTEQLELLFPASAEQDLMEALTVWLQRQPWSAVRLPGLRQPARLPGWLAQRVVFRARATPFHYRLLPATWKTFVAGLNKSMRDNIKYYPRLLARRGHAVAFDVACTPAEVSDALPILFALHRARAHAQMRVKHGDRFRLPQRRAFFRELAPRLAARGQLRIGVLKVGNQSVAAQLWMECGSAMFLYYSGSDPTWAKYSVTMVATLEAIKDGMARGLSRVEFLRGGGQFKERWDTSVRLRQGVLVARRPWLVRNLVAVRATHRAVFAAVRGTVASAPLVRRSVDREALELRR